MIIHLYILLHKSKTRNTTKQLMSTITSVYYIRVYTKVLHVKAHMIVKTDYRGSTVLGISLSVS